MDGLKKHLRNEILRDPNVKLLATEEWTLPIQTIDVEFETVKRTKMDVLMKMLLIAFRTSGFSAIEEVSEILVVEPLFIQDSIDRMSRAGLIVMNGDVYSLTEAGRQQLDSGTFVESPEIEEATVHYSPSHELFLTGEPGDDEGKTYRYAAEFRHVNKIRESEWRAALDQLDITISEGDSQKVVHAILSVNELERVSVPCLEFRLHQTAEDRLFARVWNTMTGQWDETLEKQIMEKEIAEWRERYLKD
ncbi:hypothetical protein [Sporosarcina highlanderae]|uniref:Uncharacterized protein n=1 Tax=Sporosarcina highlanderae TaxID=3035916 RepID=A0ABT8JS88_9BACL|nr:hypothetical protein [Sporosarcina highlanderae]MDN4608034.1 hypothetical protein [Sporosarcina highlanderae]